MCVYEIVSVCIYTNTRTHTRAHTYTHTHTRITCIYNHNICTRKYIYIEEYSYTYI